MGERVRKNILLVEDNPDDEALTLRALARAKVPADIEVVRDGAAALARLASTPRLPDLVLLDLKLPKLSGVDVIRAVRADPRTRLLPVVVLTSSDEDEDVLSSYRAGANSYVRKPVQFDAFASAVSDLGRFWIQHAQSPLRTRGGPP